MEVPSTPKMHGYNNGLQWKIPSINGWFGGTPLFGNPHLRPIPSYTMIHPKNVVYTMVNVNRHKPEVIVAHYFIRPPNAQIHKPTRVSVEWCREGDYWWQFSRWEQKQIRSVWSILKWSSPGFWPTSSVFLIWYHVRQGHRSCWRPLKCQLKTSRTGNDFRGWVKTCQNMSKPILTIFWGTSRNIHQWIGLRENLNRKPWFLPLDMGVSCKFSLKPIHWIQKNKGVRGVPLGYL